MMMIPILPRDITVPPSVLKRRFAICTIRVVPIGRRYYERRGGISIDRSEHGLFIRMVDSGNPPYMRTKRLSQSDWVLLDSLDTRHKRPHHTGRFLTMHKRRRKRLLTRSLTQDHALLDDIHHGQVQCVLERVNQWPFNAFILDNVTGALIEEGYHSTNPYHNSVHATDVTQAMHCFLQEKKIREYLTPLEIMASLIAAVTHDVDHPGVNQPFLIATSNHLAALYENSSVLENHHWRSAIGCLLESHVAEELEDCRPELQKQISSLILATDITRQQEFLVRFKRYLDQDLLDMKLEEHRHFILQIALKCADISNPCRPWEVSKKWSQKVCEEFFRQGDYERQLNLPVTALCDRQSSSVPKIQAGFFTFVVYPLFEEWHRFLGDGLSDDMMKNLHGNKLKWDALIMQEKEEMVTGEEVSGEGRESKECSRQDESPSSESSSSKTNKFLAIPDLSFRRHKVGRRHSVPLSMPEPPTVTRTITRRESLAIGEKKSRRLFESVLVVEEEEEDELTSSLSFLSNNNGDSDDGAEVGKRPLSSENLIPELSITSITTVTEASRLLSVLNRGNERECISGKSQLTRQQTFPPLQACFRQRYFSTTAEMTHFMSTERDKLKSSGSEGSYEEDQSEPHCGTKHGCKMTGVILRESNRHSLRNSDSDKPNGSSREKYVKAAKLVDGGLTEAHEKENIDPRIDLDVEGSSFARSGRNSTQGYLSRRRGSAPVGSEVISSLALALRTRGDRYPRRGSVPVDAMRFNAADQNNVREECSLYPSQQHCPYQRRGSIPAESGCLDTGKARSRNKKILRRRSSGGPEMFCSGENAHDGGRWKMEILPMRYAGEFVADPMATRRRGSLPIDVLLATHSGDHRETHDS